MPLRFGLPLPLLLKANILCNMFLSTGDFPARLSSHAEFSEQTRGVGSLPQRKVQQQVASPTCVFALLPFPLKVESAAVGVLSSDQNDANLPAA